MDVLPPAIDVPARRSSCMLVLFIVIAAHLVLLSVVALIGPPLIAGLFHPERRNGFSIGEGQCVVDESAGTALAQIPFAPLKEGADHFKLEPLLNDDVFLVNVTALPQGMSLEASRTSVSPSIRSILDQSDGWADIRSSPTSVVLEFRRDMGVSETALDGITIWWGIGEMGHVQDVDLNLVWTTNSCSVTTPSAR